MRWKTIFIAILFALLIVWLGTYGYRIYLSRTVCPDNRFHTFASKAAMEGSLRTIIGVKDTYQSNPALSIKDDDAAHDAVTIRAVDAVLAKLAGYNYRLNGRFIIFPGFGMRSDAYTICALGTYPEVTSISGDEPLNPLN